MNTKCEVLGQVLFATWSGLDIDDVARFHIWLECILPNVMGSQSAGSDRRRTTIFLSRFDNVGAKGTLARASVTLRIGSVDGQVEVPYGTP
jgi:hypothetical protein